MSKLRVLQVVPDFGVGGAERMVISLIEHLDKSRFDVAAVSLFGRQRTPFEARLDETGTTMYYLHKKLGFDPRMYPRLFDILRKWAPDIVHSHRGVLRYLWLPLVFYGKARGVHTVHSIAEREVEFLGKLVHHVAFRNGVTPVAIAPQVQASIAKIYKYRCAVLIHNGVALDEFQIALSQRDSTRESLGVRDQQILILCVANLTTPKNHLMLVEAFALVQERLSNALLLLAGDGTLRSTLEQRCSQLGIADSVKFLGQRDDLPALLAAADIVVLTSNWEGSPISLIEAMAAGRPIVATRVGGVPDLVEHGVSGFLVERNDTPSFAAAVAQLAHDARLRLSMGETAYGRARERFDAMQMAAKYGALYADLAAGRSATA